MAKAKKVQLMKPSRTEGRSREAWAAYRQGRGRKPKWAVEAGEVPPMMKKEDRHG